MAGGKYKHLFDGAAEPHIIAETPDLVVLAKAAGMETVSRDGGTDLTTLAREARGEPGLVPVHRLDRDTSGAQLFARNPAAEEELVRLFRQRRIDKTYLALTLGVPRNRSGVINRNLSEWAGGHRPVRIVKNGGLEASTSYELLAASDALGSSPGGGAFRIALVAFSPRQGRTHQIRVHAAGFGYPILGDDQYGNRAANRLVRDILGLRRQALHSHCLAFEWRGARVKAVCPLAADMRAASGKAFGGAEW